MTQGYDTTGGMDYMRYLLDVEVQRRLAGVAEASQRLRELQQEQIDKPAADLKRQIDQATFDLEQRKSEHAMALADKQYALQQQQVGNQSQQYDVDLAQRQFEQRQQGLAAAGEFNPNAKAQLPYHYQNDQLTRDYRSLYNRDPTWEEKQALMPWYSRAVQPNAVTTPTPTTGEDDATKEANVRQLIERDLGRALTQPEWDTWKTGRVAPGSPQINPGSKTTIGEILTDTTFDKYRNLMPAASQQQWQQNTGRVVPTAAQNEENRQEAWVKQQVEKDVGRPITAAEWETWKTGRVAAGSPQINEGSQTKEGDVLVALPTDKWRAYMPDRWKQTYQQNTGRNVAAPDPTVTAEAPWGHAPTGSGTTQAQASGQQQSNTVQASGRQGEQDMISSEQLTPYQRAMLANVGGGTSGGGSAANGYRATQQQPQPSYNQQGIIGPMLGLPGQPAQGTQPGGGYNPGVSGGPNPYTGTKRVNYNPLTGEYTNPNVDQQAQDLADWQALQRSGIETGELTGYYNGQMTAAERRAGENLQFQQAQMAANPANAAAMAAYRGQAPWQQAMTQAVDGRYRVQGQGGAGGGQYSAQTPGTAPGGQTAGTGGQYQGSYVPGGREMNTAQYQQMTPSERTAFSSYVTASQGKSLGDWEQEHKRWQPQQQRSASSGGWR